MSMGETTPHWRFAEMTPAQIAENPVQGEFFTSAADMPDRLVREAIQNSMDAALDDETVRVRFAFSGQQHAIPSDRARSYIDGLERHLDAVLLADARQPASRGEVREETRAVYRAARLVDQPLEWLVVEDFGTRGLTGDINANGANEPGNNFWGFFRQIGISTKGEDAAGSWGLGKWVFPDASQINAFLALTRRPGESESLLMGLAILKTHEKDGKRYPAYGHFAASDAVTDSEWFQLPVRSSDSSLFIGGVADNFRLKRADRTGLSVIIPHPNGELTPASLARAVITQYFLPIMLGRLEVTIEHPEEEIRIIDAEHIEEELEWIGHSDRDEESEESMRGLLALARWAIDVADDQRVSIVLPRSKELEPSTGSTEFDLEQLRQRFQRGERLAFELRCSVQERSDPVPSESRFHVFLERAEELPQGHDYFVRGNLSIPEMDHLLGHKARALLLVEGNSKLGHLLRDSEGPAHIRWDPQAARVKENWMQGARQRVYDIRRAPLRIVQALVERPVERQLDALADLFPADIASPRAAAGRSTPNSTSNGGSPTLPGTLPSPVRLIRTPGGFRLLPNDKYPVSVVDSNWRVRFAYALARGSKNRAFAQFEQGVKDDCPDFSVRDGLEVDIHGCQAQTTADNSLEISIDEDVFSVSVTGFDANRDVLVEVDQVQESSLAINDVVDEVE